MRLPTLALQEQSDTWSRMISRASSCHAELKSEQLCILVNSYYKLPSAQPPMIESTGRSSDS